MTYASMNAYAKLRSAVSPEAENVAAVVAGLVRSTEESQTLFGDKAVAISDLNRLASECAEPGWDGGGAIPIDPVALHYAGCVIRALPYDVPIPEFAPEPDGSISLDWLPSRHRMFSLSVGRSDRLSYAWLDGADKGHGVARFDGASIPARVLDGIKSVVEPYNAALRVA